MTAGGVTGSGVTQAVNRAHLQQGSTADKPAKVVSTCTSPLSLLRPLQQQSAKPQSVMHKESTAKASSSILHPQGAALGVPNPPEIAWEQPALRCSKGNWYGDSEGLFSSNKEESVKDNQAEPERSRLAETDAAMSSCGDSKAHASTKVGKGHAVVAMGGASATGAAEAVPALVQATARPAETRARLAGATARPAAPIAGLAGAKAHPAGATAHPAGTTACPAGAITGATAGTAGATASPAGTAHATARSAGMTKSSAGNPGSSLAVMSAAGTAGKRMSGEQAGLTRTTAGLAGTADSELSSKAHDASSSPGTVKHTAGTAEAAAGKSAATAAIAHTAVNRAGSVSVSDAARLLLMAMRSRGEPAAKPAPSGDSSLKTSADLSHLTDATVAHKHGGKPTSFTPDTAGAAPVQSQAAGALPQMTATTGRSLEASAGQAGIEAPLDDAMRPKAPPACKAAPNSPAQAANNLPAKTANCSATVADTSGHTQGEASLASRPNDTANEAGAAMHADASREVATKSPAKAVANAGTASKADSCAEAKSDGNLGTAGDVVPAGKAGKADPTCQSEQVAGLDKAHSVPSAVAAARTGLSDALSRLTVDLEAPLAFHSAGASTAAQAPAPVQLPATEASKAAAASVPEQPKHQQVQQDAEHPTCGTQEAAPQGMHQVMQQRVKQDQQSRSQLVAQHAQQDTQSAQHAQQDEQSAQHAQQDEQSAQDAQQVEQSAQQDAQQLAKQNSQGSAQQTAQHAQQIQQSPGHAQRDAQQNTQQSTQHDQQDAQWHAVSASVLQKSNTILGHQLDANFLHHAIFALTTADYSERRYNKSSSRPEVMWRQGLLRWIMWLRAGLLREPTLLTAQMKLENILKAAYELEPYQVKSAVSSAVVFFFHLQFSPAKCSLQQLTTQ